MKKGFTLIELLAVIVVLAIIAIIAIPNIISGVSSSRESTYKLNENAIDEASKIYLANNSDLLPVNNSYSNVILLSELVDNNYIRQVEVNSNVCEGYIIVTSKEEQLLTKPFIKCGNYETLGYKSSILAKPKILSAEYLIVAGGGGGGYRHGAGGGAGGLLHEVNFPLVENTSYSINIGVGGAGGLGSSTKATNGGNSYIDSIIAIGGGGGGQFDSYRTGSDGGSAGGSTSNVRTLATYNQGNNGGINTGNTTPYNHGGGGGAGGSGTDGDANSCGDGGVGIYFPQFSSFGEEGYFAGGGGGGSHNPIPIDNKLGFGGLGGGGNSGIPGIDSPGEDGIPNTGGGGGGASTSSSGISKGGNGGSGIILIRYPGLPIATGGEITIENGYTIHAFKTLGISNFQTNFAF